MPLRKPSKTTNATTKYQYTRAIYMLVVLNMPSLPMSIPPMLPIPLMSIVAIGDSEPDDSVSAEIDG
jgi:hypothetical protein